MAEVDETSKKRALWFTFSGAGAHREGAGRDLMRIPTFAATIERAAAALRPFGVDLVWILTDAPATTFEDVAISMVSITAVQIALIDVLRAIGLYPDGIFAASLGEIGAAYADETLTVEQSVLAAYWLGRCLMEAKVPMGPKTMMYITKDEFELRNYASEIEIMGYYSDNTFAAGPELSLVNLANQLRSEGIVVKMFGASLLHYHTSHVEPAMPAYRKQLESIICNPKPHSPKWISTSMPRDKWNSDEGRYINADFFVNSMRVPFDMITPFRVMPQNAVFVEITANAKMLRYMTALPSTLIPIELISSDAPVSAEFLIKTICKIYEVMGRQPPIERILAVFGEKGELKSKH